ncbi:hypothetical protein Ocin01_15681 [Orchesella cincta]|uniref:CARD domain-containing protein n=1 Tax=Orchesella cincta TaxID=48709 RepID=A0A1D2MDB6_ORCCI|nr:hypothetical protein Ocin01_15681 [Orchesella cincta]
MLDNERIVLKENANLLANLLTENVPYLLANYLQNGVISENEREAIISASSAHDIKIKLLETLADKEEISLQSVMQGLEATENHCVSKEIESLLAGKSDNEQDQEVTDGSGDRLEDVNAYATNLVDDVIATAEETTSNQVSQEELEPVVLDDVGLTETEEVEPIDSGAEVDPAEENLVEASVEVHKVDTEPPQSEDESGDAVDKSVTFPERVATVIEDHKRVEVTDHHEEQPTADEDGDYSSHGLDARNESENEDDQIDIEKEFVMPTEPETNNNNDLASDHKQTPVLTRMVSNEIIIDDEDKPSSPISKEPVADGDGDGLDALMARKALVRQQVEKFEKTAPGGGKGKVQYSFRSSTQESEAKAAEEEGSKVKNLKNFFQRLSTSESNTPPPAGPAKSVGKLKVTFPS